MAGADPNATVCALLAELLSREVDDSLLEILRAPEVKTLLTTDDSGLLPLLEDEWDAGAAEAHAVEFCRLFVQPCVCLPLAGRWAEGVNDEQLSVQRWIPEGTELPFAPHLAELSDTHIAKILALRAGLASAPPSLVAEYEQQMIQPWAPAFAEHLGNSAELPIYRSTAKILSALLD